jgi:hypothetical protein
MRAPHLRSVHRLSLVAPFAVAAIACGGSTLGGIHDSGAPEGSTYDAGGPVGDAGGPTPDTGAPSDAAPGQDGHAGQGTTRIASGDSLVLWGVTGDDYAVYSTGASNPSF